MTHAIHPPEASASDALSELARSWRRYEGDFERAVREITEVGVRALHVARSSVWLLDESRTELRCVDLFEVGRGHAAAAVLRAAEFPAYFDALESEEPLAAHDAHGDPRTRDFSAPYLTPLGIGAMLDAPVRRGRRLVGVVCHEHVGGPRRWTLHEQKDAAFLASLASLALELSERARREALLAATLESTGEGILAADGERVVAFNRRFLQLWRLDAAELTSLAHVRARMAAATEQRSLEPPNDNAARRATTSTDSCELVELADGRVLEWVARPQMLGEQVVGEVWSFRDVTSQRRVEAELRESEARMRDLAIRDGLTGLYNRRHALEQLAAALARSIIGGERLAVALVDIDHFKRVNDELGHLTGDAVLRDFSRVLVERVRATDLVGRYGGEEFVVVLRGASAAAGRAVLEQVRGALDLRVPDGGLPKYTFSAGVAELGTDGDDVTALLAAADERLYGAKRNGRARVL